MTQKGEKCKIGSNTTILDESVIPANSEIPENCIFGGSPAMFQGTVSDSYELDRELNAKLLYENIYACLTDYMLHAREERHKAQLVRGNKAKLNPGA